MCQIQEKGESKKSVSHQEADSVVPPYFEKSHFPVDNHILLSRVQLRCCYMEKHKYDSCEVIVIFSCFILSRLGVGVETKTTKDQVWQVDFSTTALLFTVSILLEKNKNDTGTADSFFQERNISFSTSLVILCLPLTEHHCLCIFLFLRWTTLCSFRCTSTHIHLKLNYFGHLSYFYRWLTRGTCSVQQP